LQRQGLVEEAIQIVTAMDEAKQAQYIKHYLGVLYLEASNLKQAFFCFKAALNLQPDYLPSLIEVASIISEPHPKQAIAILKYLSFDLAKY
jgi:tetratricopeptide (TPR) repeat protein